MVHWFDDLLADVRRFVGGKPQVLVNGGLSVSGLQHVGRLRGELVLCQCLARELRADGREVVQHLVQYTQDQWKGKAWQLSQFPRGEGPRYVGWRLIDVPDPHGCHANWVSHYWAEFASFLEIYTPGVRVTSTTEMYRREDMRKLIVDVTARAEDVRVVVNKYRGRHPEPPGWIPFEPYCNRCRRVGNARALRINGIESVDYECDCGDRGTSKLELGKLNWRLEWPAVWKVLAVDVEPFGKDHATPGGSRDSCKEIAETILGFRPPMGIPYEWVGLSDRGKDLGDMGSSDFLGFTPTQWLEVGDPEVLRYPYAFNPISRRVVLDLGRVDALHDAYDLAEAAFYADEREGDEGNFARSYELAQL
ncbi:MAG: lysine--tRNA ligase, partial [Euryarchaeota archaeon]|nr:lysine--tRNA ligase [Euryarchaeota archaeon]